MTENPSTDDREHDETPEHPEQEHPAHEAHGGSMAPGLVDDTGHPTGSTPPTSES